MKRATQLYLLRCICSWWVISATQKRRLRLSPSAAPPAYSPVRRSVTAPPTRSSCRSLLGRYSPGSSKGLQSSDPPLTSRVTNEHVLSCDAVEVSQGQLWGAAPSRPHLWWAAGWGHTPGMPQTPAATEMLLDEADVTELCLAWTKRSLTKVGKYC